MIELVEAYMKFIAAWIDSAERDALEIQDAQEYQDMQDRIIMIKHHFTVAKLVRNSVVDAEKG